MAESGTISRAGRIEEVDGLRGFALLGILVVNILIFADPGSVLEESAFDGPVADAVHVIDAALFQSKFFVLFSFLFGYSFTLQMAAAERDDASVVPRTLRRAGMLVGIGAVHAIVLWMGDILMLYGLLGLILLALRKIRPRTAVITAIVIAAVWLLVFAALGLLFAMSGQQADQPMFAGIGQWALESTQAGGTAYMTYNLGMMPFMAFILVVAQGPMVMAMFLLGYAAGRVRLAETGETLDRWLPRIQWIGLLVGAPGAMAMAWALIDAGGQGFVSAAGIFGGLAAPFLSAFYVATLLRMSRRGSRILRIMAPAGRMAATNYIMQSVLMCVVFTGYGFALAGSVPPLGILGVAVAIYLLQLAYSTWWMRRFRYGPLEWLLRSVTYSRRASMRVRA